jgi:hypothetical protein
VPNIKQYLNLVYRREIRNDYSAIKLGVPREVVVPRKDGGERGGTRRKVGSHLNVVQDAFNLLGSSMNEALSQLRDGDTRREKMAGQIYLELNLLELNTLHHGSNGDEWMGLVEGGKVVSGIKVSEGEEVGLEVTWEPMNDVGSGALMIDGGQIKERDLDKQLWHRALLLSIRWKIANFIDPSAIFEPLGVMDDQLFFHELAKLAHGRDEVRQLIRDELQRWLNHLNLEPSLEEVLRNECHIRSLYIRSQKHTKQQLNTNYELKQLLRELDGNPRKRREVLERMIGIPSLEGEEDDGVREAEERVSDEEELELEAEEGADEERNREVDYADEFAFDEDE